MTRETVSNVSFLMGEYFDDYLSVKGAEDDVLKKGSLLVYSKPDGKYKAFTGGVEKPTAIVLSETIIPAAGHVDVPAVVAGRVNGNGLELPDGVTLDAVGQSSEDEIAITADEGNTGDGAPGTITQGNLAKAGTYSLECVNADDSGSEIFAVYDPDGFRLEDLTVDVAYDNGHFAVTIADGDYDFVVGDSFEVVPQVNADGTLRMILKENGIIAEYVTQLYE
jgi:hypothetical protein